MDIGTENKTNTVDDILSELELDIETTEEQPVEIKEATAETSTKEVAENVVKVVEKKIDPTTNDLLIDFAVRYIELQRQKKVIDLDIKALKQEYAEQGVAYQNTLKALTSLQKHKKMSNDLRYSIEAIEATLEQSKKVQDALETLAKVD